MAITPRNSHTCRLLLLVGAAICCYGSCSAREWTDATGQYSWKADLFAASEDLAILRDRKGKLHAVQIKELSEADRKVVNKYLKDDESQVSQDVHTWTMASGLKVKGTVLGYKSGPVEVANRNGVPYVNRKRFRELDPVYQTMVIKIVAASESEDLETEEDFKKWARTLRREKRTIQVDGVLMKLHGGEEYAVPLFLFSKPDREALENGWRQWSADKATEEQRAYEDALVRAEAQQYQQQEEQKTRKQEQIQMMHLGLLAVDAGLTSLWEVQLMPPRGAYGRPVRVVVPANDSQQARQAALQKYPGYVPGASRQVSRR